MPTLVANAKCAKSAECGDNFVVQDIYVSKFVYVRQQNQESNDNTSHWPSQSRGSRAASDDPMRI